MTVRCSIKKIAILIAAFATMTALSLTQVKAFSGRDGDEVITCTKLTEPFAILDVASQGGTNFGRYYVQTITGGAEFYLYDIELNELLAVIPLEGDGSAYKNNNANFGTEYYDVSDPMPLLYVSSAYDYEINVFRFYVENDTWKVMTVQTISYPTIDNEAGFYSCNVVLDNENGFLYLTPLSYIYTTLENEQHFYKFRMPKLSDGDVELSIADAIDHCAVWDYIHAPQGALIVNGYLYQLHGVGNAFLRVFDFEQGKYIKTYNLFNYGYNMEPESLGYYNGTFYSMDDSLEVWRISIEEVEPIEQGEGTTKTVALTEWEKGSINPTTGKESTSTKIARMSHQVMTLGADKVIIETPKHYKGQGAGNFYKWRMIWYDGDTCLGLAAEQCDFTTFTEFEVPENADSFRIAIASVYGGKTQKTFPLTSFVKAGGISVKLFTENAPESENRIQTKLKEWETGSFYSDGRENDKSRIARMVECSYTFGAEILTIDAPVHYSGASTVDTYYKWCVQWYDGDDCIGLASEQADFSTVTEYRIPENADKFRIKIASVVGNETEDPFPLEEFIAGGGINISLIGVSKTEMQLNEWESGSLSPITGIENSLTRIARTDYVSTQGAYGVHVEPLVHYSGENTADTYYKWRIIWFSGDVCIGIADEQTSFSQNMDFAVPENADSFRMMIASVIRGTTEDPFPLETFLRCGGTTVDLINIAATD